MPPLLPGVSHYLSKDIRPQWAKKDARDFVYFQSKWISQRKNDS